MDVFLDVDSPSDFSPSQVCVASCPCVVHLGGTKGWCHFLRDALRSLRALDMGHLAGGLFFFFVDFRVTLKVGDVLRWRRPWRGAGLLSLFCKCCVFFGGVSGRGGWRGAITFFRLRFKDVAYYVTTLENLLQVTSKTLLIRRNIFFNYLHLTSKTLLIRRNIFK